MQWPFSSCVEMVHGRSAAVFDMWNAADITKPWKATTIRSRQRIDVAANKPHISADAVAPV
jgi:hypothetical protein